MVQLLQNLADEFADFAQGMVRGNPLLRMNVRKHPALILRPSAHLQSSRRIRGGLNHHSFALARFFSKLLEDFFDAFRDVLPIMRAVRLAMSSPKEAHSRPLSIAFASPFSLSPGAASLARTSRRREPSQGR